MFWILLFVWVFVFFLGLWTFLNYLSDRSTKARAEKRAKDHFQDAEDFRRGIK